MTLIERLRAEDGPYDINPEDDVYGLNRKALLIKEAAAALEEMHRYKKAWHEWRSLQTGDARKLFDAALRCEAAEKALEALQDECAQHLAGPMPSLERIKSAHSHLANAEIGETAAGHRPYSQGQEGCYICALVHLLEEAQRDAARYRYIRGQQENVIAIFDVQEPSFGLFDYLDARSGVQLDAAIDAAMKADA